MPGTGTGTGNPGTLDALSMDDDAKSVGAAPQDLINFGIDMS